jgi:hypothetical protein
VPVTQRHECYAGDERKISAARNIAEGQPLQREGSLPSYRMYHLNAAGEIKGPSFDLDCSDDEHAIQRATPYVLAGGRVEIWHGARLVKTLTDPGTTP